MTPLDYSQLFQHIRATELEPWLETLPDVIEHNFNPKRWGDIPRWMNALDGLPDINPEQITLDQSIVGVSAEHINADLTSKLNDSLKGLHPWRKGPFNILGTFIDTEWRSDMKWDRLKDHIQPLDGKTVLDVGCGSGYHCWRMRGAGANRVIGIEPSPLFVIQFQALQKYIQDFAVHVIPAKLEDIPPKLCGFDTTFSMGILYHRRSPLDHLFELKDTLKPGGELILETLVVDGPKGFSLVPEGRYAKMGNVWFLPSILTLESWLKKAGLINIRCINTCFTTEEEQRSTEWMTFESLKDFLDPENPSLSIEGYPAPQRAIILANKPE